MKNIEKAALHKLQGSLRTESRISEVFHENTKLTPLMGQAYFRHIEQILNTPSLVKIIQNPAKIFSLCDTVKLPSVVPAKGLEESIARRRSIRSYSGEPIGLDQIARLLHFAYGITDRKNGFRAVASGGALYPLELYVVPVKSNDLAPGVYHYNSVDHSLDVVTREDRWSDLESAIGFKYFDTDSIALVIIISAIFSRSTMKYLDRGYRMILMEAGAVANNITLMAASMGLGSSALGGFLDDRVSALLDIDGLDEAPLIPLALGRMPHPPGSSNGNQR